jgi:dTDP-4-dehydrorhamnose 3,5-epimerase
VLDIVVNIRPGSIQYGKWWMVQLSADNKKQLYVPKGYAHGYLALEDNTVFYYKCDQLYSKEHEGGIFYNDPALGIEWPKDPNQFILSDKDKKLPLFGKHRIS